MGFALLFVATTVVTSAISIQPAQAQMQFHSSSAQNTPAVTIPTHFATAETDNCGFGWALDWIACPLSGGLLQFITDMVRNVIADLLYMDTNQLFSPEFKTAWTVFQRIGFAVIIISGLIMVISHSLGMELFDAYTIKKLLPRLMIAIFGMAVAWPMLKFVITFFNDIGLWTHSLIVKPFENIGNDTNIFDIQNPANIPNSIVQNSIGSAMEWGIVVTAMLAGAIQAAFLGVAGVLSLVATIALAVLIGVATLIIRQIIIMVTVLFAPLAIACYVLPGTKKIANFWQNTLTTTLMMFPIVMALIGAGEAMSRVAASAAENSVAMKLMSIIVYFAPYFMIPLAFKMAGGLMSNIFGMVNDRSRGVFDRLRNFRDETKKKRRSEYASGFKGNGLAAQWASRTELAHQGGFSVTRKGRERYEAAHKKHVQDVNKKLVEADAMFALGDTNATRAAMHATSRDDFINHYKQLGGSQHDAEQAAARIEQLGGSWGSAQTRLAAFRGHLADNTSYQKADGTTDFVAMGQDAAQMVEAGLLSVQDAAGMMNNQMRPDYSALGFGDKMGLVSTALRSAGYTIDAATDEHYQDLAYEANRNSGALLGHTRNVQASAKTASRRTDAPFLTSQDVTAQEFATLANMQDMMTSAPPQAREEFSRVLLEDVDLEDLPPQVRQMFTGLEHDVQEKPRLDHNGVPIKDIHGNPIIDQTVIATGRTRFTKQALMEHLRSNPQFTARRRELNSAAERYRQAQTGVQVPPTPGGMPQPPTIT